MSLLSALREDLGVRGPVKDGCSPQGQCGCCTVLVDGAPRVACVTPVRRVAGRSVTTAAGLDPEVSGRLVDAFVRHGASQCGFCTPGIICRLAPLGPDPDAAKVESALLAHLCRCTGWRTIVDAACDQASPGGDHLPGPGAARRAELEGATAQAVGAEVVGGGGGFADDRAPDGCLVAVPDGSGGWAVGETLEEARLASGKVQGRRSGQSLSYPLAVPEGDWDLTLQTTWVEPAYLELDASWCLPGAEPASPLANGGAFGGKAESVVTSAARELAERSGRPVRVVLSREDSVRLGGKRPPVAAGVRLDGTGVMRLASPAHAGAGSGSEGPLAETVRSVAPGLALERAPVTGPPVSERIRAAGWAEAAVLVCAAGALRDGAARIGSVCAEPVTAEVTGPSGGRSRATVEVDGTGRPVRVVVEVACGPPLDEVTLRSYVTGAAHMGIGWVCSEAIAVGDDGVPDDLTIRSFGILRARDTPPIEVQIDPTGAGETPVNGSDAAFAAVAAATWIAQGLPSRWPTRRGRMA